MSEKSFEVTGGSMNVAGALTSNTMVVQNAEANVSGSLTASTLTWEQKIKVWFGQPLASQKVVRHNSIKPKFLVRDFY